MKNLSVLCLVSIVCAYSLRADCPTPTKTTAWADFNPAYYSFRVGYPKGDDNGQSVDLFWGWVGNAEYDTTVSLNGWNYANTNQNTSYVQFYADPADWDGYSVTYPSIS